MKRTLTLSIFLALLFALALPAAADVAYMPQDDFYEKHWQDCQYVNRWFYANGADGYVLAYVTPEIDAATPLPNGMKYYISSVYKGEWGVLEYDPDTLENDLGNGSVSGWVKMSDMVADYDTDAFTADHAAELLYESAELLLAEDEVAYGYKYPGSGVSVRDFSGKFFSEPFLLSPLFTDPAGRTWGFIGYYYGHQDCWICIDDPFNDALPPDENCVTIVTRAAPEPTETPSSAETTAPAEAPRPDVTPAPGKTVALTPPADDETLQQAAKDNRGSGPYLAAGAGGVIVIAAAVLAAALRKKRK